LSVLRLSYCRLSTLPLWAWCHLFKIYVSLSGVRKRLKIQSKHWIVCSSAGKYKNLHTMHIIHYCTGVGTGRGVLYCHCVDVYCIRWCGHMELTFTVVWSNVLLFIVGSIPALNTISPIVLCIVFCYTCLQNKLW
jgi:hypothetical protein